MKHLHEISAQMFILLVLLAAMFAGWLVAVITAFVVLYSAAAKRPERLSTFALIFPLLILWVNYRLGLPPVAFWYVQGTQTVIVFIALQLCVFVCSIEKPFVQQTATRMGILAALCFLAAMFSPLVWTVAEGRQQFGNLPAFQSQSIVRVPAADCAREPGAAYVHVSDLHFTAGQTRTRDNDMPGDFRANELLTVLAAIRPDVVFVTGDITDTGSDVQWLFAETFFRNIKEATGALVVLAPGNHDFSPALTESATGRFNDNTVRAVSFFSMASRIMPDVTSAAGSAHGGRRTLYQQSFPDGKYTFVPSGADRSYRETRIENMLTDEKGKEVQSANSLSDVRRTPLSPVNRPP